MLSLDSVTLRRCEMDAGMERVVPATGEALVHTLLVVAGAVDVSPTRDARRRWHADAGQGLFLTSRGDHVLSWARRTEIVVVRTPAKVIASYGVPVDQADDPMFACGSALLPSAAAYFRALLTNPLRPDRVAAYAMSRLSEEMVASLFLERASVGAGPVRAQPSLYRRALALIASQRMDPVVSAGWLATELSVSVRHLQRAFAAEGTSPTEEIRRLRVEMAVQLLTDARYDPLSIEDVARYTGFGSADDLRRAFRLQGVPSPTRLRANGGSPRRIDERVLSPRVPTRDGDLPRRAYSLR